MNRSTSHYCHPFSPYFRPRHATRTPQPIHAVTGTRHLELPVRLGPLADDPNIACANRCEPICTPQYVSRLQGVRNLLPNVDSLVLPVGCSSCTAPEPSGHDGSLCSTWRCEPLLAQMQAVSQWPGLRQLVIQEVGGHVTLLRRRHLAAGSETETAHLLLPHSTGTLRCHIVAYRVALSGCTEAAAAASIAVAE